MQIPLEKRLRKRAHKDIGLLQDELVEMLYGIAPNLVFHGGTAIWRCFSGGRFSEDLDIYIDNLPENFEQKFTSEIKSRGLTLPKFKQTENLIFCKVEGPDAAVKVEINFAAKKKGEAVQYEKMDGSSMVVLCIPLPELVEEKAGAYLDRKFIRDIYDVFFLLPKAGKPKPNGNVIKLAKESPLPVDEDNLANLIYSGAVPTFAQMLFSIRGRI